MALVEQSISEYLTQLDRMDRKETPSAPRQVVRLKERITTLKQEMRRLRVLKARMEAAPDGQVSLVDPDARSMASQGKGTGIVGYNVQTAVDTKNHLIVTHEVTNVGSDRHQLKKMAEAAREALGTEKLTAIADRGYYSGEEIKACDDAGIVPLIPKNFTSTSRADGRYDKSDFVYIRKRDAYRCPAGSMPFAASRASRKGWRSTSTGPPPARAAPYDPNAQPATTDESVGGNMKRYSRRCRHAWIAIHRECNCGVRLPSIPSEPSNLGWGLRTSSVEPCQRYPPR